MTRLIGNSPHGDDSIQDGRTRREEQEEREEELTLLLSRSLEWSHHLMLRSPYGWTAILVCRTFRSYLTSADSAFRPRCESIIDIYTKDRCLITDQDAFAILIAAHHPSLKLLGITTIHGNASLENTTANAGSVLEAIGRPDIPVYPGSRKPFCRPAIHAPNIHGKTPLPCPMYH